MAYASHRELPSNAQFLRIFLIKKNILGTLSVHEILQALLNLCYFVTSFKNIPICAWTYRNIYVLYIYIYAVIALEVYFSMSKVSAYF